MCSSICGWSDIPEELLTLIGKRLETVNDHFSLRLVCKSWWQSSSGLFPLTPQPPWLMLPSHIEDNGDMSLTHDRRGFLGLSKRESGGGGGREEFIDKVYEFYLPEANQCRCIGSKGNWIVTLDMELKMQIINPFSRVRFDLPSQSTLTTPLPYAQYLNNEQLRELYISKVVLSSTPEKSTNSSRGKCVALAIHHLCKCLAIARPGDISWTEIDVSSVEDAILFNGKFYFIDSTQKLFMCDFDCYPPKRTTLSDVRFPPNGPIFKHYLVEWLGELLLVIRHGTTISVPGQHNYFTTKLFKVFKFKFDTKGWELVQNLGHHSLFLGFNTSVSVLASPWSNFRGNCIYFTDDHHHRHYGSQNRTVRTQTIEEGGHDMGIFDLDIGTVQLLYDEIVVTSRFSTPIWIVPKSDHRFQS